MKLHELLKIVTESDAEDWYKIVCWGAGSGPSYKFRLDAVVQGGKDHWMEVEYHGDYAVYRGDAAITMAWGLTANRDYQEEWATKFADKKASSDWVDIFYHGSLVYRELYIVVDGGRAYLPQPRNRDDLSVPKGYAHFIGMLDEMKGSVSDYARYFQSVGFKMTDEPWPNLK